MKKIWTFGIVVVAGVTLQQPATAGSRSSAHYFSSAPHYSAPVHQSSGPSRSYSNAPARFLSAPRFQNRGYAGAGARLSPTPGVGSSRNHTNSARFSGNRR